MNLQEHPTVRRLATQVPEREHQPPAETVLDGTWLRRVALEGGADDAGLVDIGRTGLDPQRDEILRNYPWTRTLLSFVVRMGREPVRGAPRSVANLEFHRADHEVTGIGAGVVATLEARGIRAVNPSMGFPMEMYQSAGGAIWVVSHKPVAVEAGLGHMGIHRNLIHPKYGNLVLLGTVLIDREASEYDHPIDYNPCLECKLCVAACPVGAIGPDGSFNFSSCFTHNYREFMGGFSDWIEQVADARNAVDYRRRISEPETSSMWQSLSHGANYKSAYCMAVCPAGEDVIGPYLRDKQRHLREVVKPLQERAEPVYVVAGSDAEAVARRKFKNKTVKPVANGLRPRTIAGLLMFMPHVFQPNQSRGLDAVFHFTFTGSEPREATITIKNRTIDLKDGLVGKADVHVTADAESWLRVLAKEKSLPVALITRKIRLKGNPRLLLAFGRCFPSASARRRPVEILPQPSQLRGEPSRYQKNDPATGKIRWRGRLTALGCEGCHAQREDVPLQAAPRRRRSLRLSARSVSHAPHRAGRHPDQALLHDRVDADVARPDRDHRQARGSWPGLALAPRRAEGWRRGRDRGAPSSFTFNGEGATGVVLIGAGVGMTLMMSVARYLTDTCWSGKIDLILGFRSPRDFMFREELAELQARNARLRITIAMSRPADEPWHGAIGRIDAALLASSVPDIVTRRAHVCGPPSMMDAVKAALRGLGVPESQIKTEAFGTIKRDPRAKGPASTEVAGSVTFQASETTAPVPVDATILDVADSLGVFIDSACRSGTCASCRVKLLSGSVKMAVEDALTDQDKADGYILACQARVRGNVAVDV